MRASMFDGIDGDNDSHVREHLAEQTPGVNVDVDVDGDNDADEIVEPTFVDAHGTEYENVDDDDANDDGDELDAEFTIIDDDDQPEPTYVDANGIEYEPIELQMRDDDDDDVELQIRDDDSSVDDTADVVNVDDVDDVAIVEPEPAAEPVAEPVTESEPEVDPEPESEPESTGIDVELLQTSPNDFGEELRKQTTAVRIRKTRWGLSKRLDKDQLARMASEFGANPEAVNAQKRLINPQDPRIKAVSSILSRASSYWRAVTVPYPDPGVRLIKTERIETFENMMAMFQSELRDATRELDESLEQMKLEERIRLNELYDERDYPTSVSSLFSLEYEYPSVEPAGCLQDLHPELYQREQERIRRRFSLAVEMAEEAFCTELSRAVDHLIDCLRGDGTGKKKGFHATSITKFKLFAERFQAMNIGSNKQLEECVDRINKIVGGIDANAIKKSRELSDYIEEQMNEVKTTFEHLLSVKPKRRIEVGDDEE